MAYDFFQRQDRARRRSWLLVGYLLAAVVLIALAVNAAVYTAAVYTGARPVDLAAWLKEPWWLLVTATVFGVVALGSLFKYLRLRGGGAAVAEMVGARALAPAARDPLERRLINVVEEMSIASGTPPPVLYVLDEEQGINAFVAGYRPTEAVMVVTRGALEKLSRDELQGVVAHEYSHILNGDMRLNVRLIAILAGILAIGVVGRMLLRGGFFRGHRRRSTRVSTKTSGAGPVVFIGIAMFILGYIGLFFGRLIKAAVSRQREFLADASSVQFTRNASGIAGALWRISQDQDGSLLVNPHAEETSHMCFGQSVKLGFARLLATHPPLMERILAVDPHFTGRQAAERIRERQHDEARRAVAAEAHASSPGANRPAAASLDGAGPDVAVGFAGATGMPAPPVAPAGAGAPDAGAVGRASAPASPGVALTMSALDAISTIGTPQPRHMAYAADLHDGLPETLLDAAHDPEHAVALVFAVLIPDIDPARARVAAAMLEHRGEGAALSAARALASNVAVLDRRARLPLVELAVPALRRLEPGRKGDFLDTIDRLVRLDGQFSVFEFALVTVLRRHLRPGPDRPDRVRFFTLGRVREPIRIVLSLLARTGAEDEDDARAAFAIAVAGIGEPQLALAPRANAQPGHLETALAALGALSPLLKKPVLQACADCVAHDGRVLVEEMELVRAVAERLDCPMPPLVPEVA